MRKLFLAIIFLYSSWTYAALNCQEELSSTIKRINPWVSNVKSKNIVGLPQAFAKKVSGNLHMQAVMSWSQPKGQYLPAGTYEGIYLATIDTELIPGKCIITNLEYLGFFPLNK